MNAGSARRLDQAERQLRAAQRALVTWSVAEQEAVAAIERLLRMNSVGEQELGFTGASDLLQRAAPAYDLMRRGDFAGAAEILTPSALDGRL